MVFLTVKNLIILLIFNDIHHYQNPFSSIFCLNRNHIISNGALVLIIQDVCDGSG
jgi:hypothetical protein